MASPQGQVDPGDPRFTELEERLELIRRNLNIPGFSAAIASRGSIAWTRGFGWADREEWIEAGPETAYHLASLTKPFASIILMQQVEAGLLDLEDPASKYGIGYESPGVIRLRHLLTHTSHGIPGASYRYQGDRFGALDQAVEQVTGSTFAELVVERIIRPLQLDRTAPNPRDRQAFASSGLDRSEYLAAVAKGYGPDGREPVEYSSWFGGAAGLLSSATDMARFAIALDEGRFLEPETWLEVYTPACSNSDEALPYGLGWFIHEEAGVKIVWHYGWWTGCSSLIIRIPEQEISFIILANTDALSRSSPGIGNGSDPRCSEVGALFLDTFVFRD